MGIQEMMVRTAEIPAAVRPPSRRCANESRTPSRPGFSAVSPVLVARPLGTQTDVALALANELVDDAVVLVGLEGSADLGRVEVIPNMLMSTADWKSGTPKPPSPNFLNTEGTPAIEKAVMALA